MPKRLLLLGASLWIAVVLCGQDKSIFDLGKLHRVRVTVSNAEWDVLQTSAARGGSGDGGTDVRQPDGRMVHVGGGWGGYFPWAHADLLVNGIELKDVGLRYKGNNSFVKPTAARPFRTNLKVKTDLFGGKADWNGAETLNFNAGVQDRSLMREAMAFAIFRAAGVPASRTAYAELTFSVPGLYDNAPGGVYVVIENVNKQFLRRELPPGTGLLMKPEGMRGGIQSRGPDWALYIPLYRPEREATPHEQQRVIEFAGLVAQPDIALFREKIGTYLDVDEFLRFIAVDVFIANNDSYLNGQHNYYLYLDPKDDKFRFIPWDLDLSMETGGGDGPNILRPTGPNNALVYKLLGNPAVAEKHRAIVKELAASVFTAPALNRMLAEAEQAISNRDPSTKAFLNSRAAFIQSLVREWEK